MDLSKVNIPQNSSKIVYSNSVLHGIVSLATKEVSGIVSLHGRGVKIKTMGQTLVIDVFVNTLSTIKCADVAFFVQENVKRNIETATTYIVKEVNVNILSVTMQNEQQENTHDE